MNLFNNCNGNNWRRKANWGSETAPLKDWYGVTTDENGRVTKLELVHNHLQGSIPAELGNLEKLLNINLLYNNLNGHIPLELSNLQDLFLRH